MGKVYFQRLLVLLMLCCTSGAVSATTYYSQSSSDATVLGNWDINRLGGGGAPANFTSGDIFVIQGTGNGGTSPHSMTTSIAWAISGAGGKIQIESGATLTATFIVAVPNFQVDNGGLYVHNAVGSTTNGSAADFPGSTTRVFGASSTVEIQKWANGGTAPVGLPAILAPGYGNLKINVATLGGSWNQTGLLSTIRGNLDIMATGSGANEFRLTGTVANTTAVGGNVNLSGGILKQSQSSGNSTLTVAGDFTIGTGTTYTPQNSSGPTIATSVIGNMIVNGTIPQPGSGHIVTYTIGGNLVINNGSMGISNSSSSSFTANVTGGITISGTGTLSSTSSGNWTITCSGDFSLSGTLFQAQGSNASGHSYIFNLGGNFNMTGGTFTGGSTSSGGELVLNFTGGTASVTYTQSGGTVTAAKPTIYNITNGKEVKLNNDITTLIASSTTGAVNINNGGTLNLQTNIVKGAGTFTLSSGGTLKIGHVLGIVSSGAIGAVQNTGTRSFNVSSFYEYNGLAAQVSGSGLPPQVSGLRINNIFGMTLSNAATSINVSLTLSSGRIKTDATHSLQLNIGAATSSVANIYGNTNQGISTSFVSGPLKIESNTTSLINFPVGKDTLASSIFAPARVTSSDAFVRVFTVEYYPSGYDTNNVDAAMHHVSKVESWDVQSNSVLPPAQARIGLSWRPTSYLCVPGCTLTDSTNAWTDLAVAHHYNDGFVLQWHLEGVAPSYVMSGNLSYGYIITNNYSSSFSPFTLASKANFNLLPLKLLELNAVKKDRQVVVLWSTKEEQQVDHYEIQRSGDGINFTNIGIIAARNTAGINNYSITDAAPVAGINYYRLKVKDQNGRTSFTPAIKIKFSGAGIAVYPNPVVEKITVTHNAAKAGAMISIYNVSGVQVKRVMVAANVSITAMKVSDLPSGVYFLIYQDGSTTVKEKFIKQ